MRQRRVLVIGGTGMLGRAVQAALRSREWSFAAPGRSEVDLLQPTTVVDALASRGFDTVINCAAWTDVDAAESQQDAASHLNGWAVGQLAESCRTAEVRLVHYSTDYVFNGRGDAPYPIDAPTEPINAYGRGKAEGERLVAESRFHGLHAMVLRTSWLYAPWGKNFVRTIARLAQEKPMLRVVNDQRGRPTSAEHLARATLDLLETTAEGTLHVTDGGETSWHGFATRIAARVNPGCRVEPCGSAEFPRPTVRPAYSVLDLSRTEALIGPRPAWEAELGSVLDRLE